MKRRLLIFLAFASLAHSQASGVGQIWSTVSGTLQNAAVANGNGTALAVNGLSSAIFTVNCSVACSGGTTINFEGSGDNSNYVALNAVQLGTGTIATTVVNQNTTITQWQVPLGGVQSIRARISAYSAGTITVTANASTAPYNPVTVQANLNAGSNTIGKVNLIPDTTSGWSFFSNSALSNTVTAVKASAGKLGGYVIGNPNASAIYIQVFNKAVGSVTLGTTVPDMVFLIPGAANGAGANVEFTQGIPLGTAITVAVTTTPTGSTAPGTGAVVNILFF